MTHHFRIEASSAKLSRRQVMIGAAGLSFALALEGPAAYAAVLGSERTGKALSPWVSIAPDGTITIMSAATEMGQGSMTSLPLIIAEELDADWSKVRIVPAPPVEAVYGNPGFQGMMYTAGSNAVTSYYTPLRQFGAQVRRVLLDNAGTQARRPGRGTHHRAERGGACEIRPQAQLRRHRALCRDAGEGAGDQARAAQESERLPADHQGRDAHRAAGQGQRHGALRHRRAGAEHAVRHGAAGAGRRLGAGQDRRQQGQGDSRRGADRALAVRRRRARRSAVGGIRGAPGADATRSPGAGPARPGASTATRASSGSLPTPRTRCEGRPSGARSAIRAPCCRRPRRRWTPSIAATTPITRRWSR